MSLFLQSFFMDNDIKLKVVGLVYNQSVVNTYGLILNEEHGNRKFSIMIGEPEAQSIALKLNNKISARPLTHDLIQNLLKILDADLQKILIYNMINDVFYSKLYLNKKGETLIVDSRTSDAVALAVRCECPIYIKSNIMNIVGTEISDNNQDKALIKNEDVNLDTLNENNLSEYSLAELNEILSIAVNEERYELAVQIRDVINRKSI